MHKFDWFPRGLRLRIAITVCCELAYLLLGYDQGNFSGILVDENFRQQFGNPGQGLEGLIVSIYNLGAFAGCSVAFMYCERLGRRLSMWIAMWFLLVGTLLKVTAFTVPQLMTGRFVSGFGMGIESSTSPVYQAELCEASKRGRLVSTQPMFVGVGMVSSLFFSYGMSFTGGALAWRLPMALQAVFPLLLIVVIPALPESPRYLCKRGDHQAALAILCDVYDAQPDDERILREQSDILHALKMKQEHGEYRWSQLLKRDKVQTGRRVLLAYGTMFMQQVSGINLVVFFIPTLLQTNVGLPRNLALPLGGVVMTMYLIGSLFPCFFLDRYGRRMPLMLGFLGCGLSMAVVATLLSQHGEGGETAKATSIATVVFFCTYMLSFGASINCVPWVYIPEVLPLHVRAKATAVAMSANWLWCFVVVILSPLLIQRLQWKAYLIFAATNISFIPLIYLFYPETTRLALEEIDWLFIAHDPVQTSRRVAREGWSAEETRRRELAQGTARAAGLRDETGPSSSEDEEVKV